MDIFLHPGDYYFADRDTRIRTILGSCVAMTFWHPQLLVGGMCHYMLPERGSEHKSGNRPAPDGRFADAAIALLLAEIDTVGAPYREYQIKLFGGGNMFPKNGNTTQLGMQNIGAARRLAKHYGFTCVAEYLGDFGHRNIIFEVWSGEVWVRHSQILPLTEYESIDRSLG
ncbi:chemotaxis protein CheD [Methylobacter sp.]|uniref:chemotaxis protein CheD n=1 Tax=Methylobacter sp. TaxID=2051955 RepID=UPI0025DCA600|nr:chemotaxis protein CheD [Methylobacter sp.]